MGDMTHGSFRVDEAFSMERRKYMPPGHPLDHCAVSPCPCRLDGRFLAADIHGEGLATPDLVVARLRSPVRRGQVVNA
jgi:hypothetical protein